MHLCDSRTPVALMPKRNSRPFEGCCICSTREPMPIHTLIVAGGGFGFFSGLHAQSPPLSQEVTSEPIVGFAAHNDQC